MQKFQFITMLFSITTISVTLVHLWFLSVFVVPLATVVVHHCYFCYSWLRLFPPWCVYCPAAPSLSRLAPFCCLHIGDIPFVLFSPVISCYLCIIIFCICVNHSVKYIRFFFYMYSLLFFLLCQKF